MLRYLPVVIVIGFVIYCLIDCIQTPAEEIRHLPKIAWIVLIVVLDVIGCVAWLLYGRPKREDGDRSRLLPGRPQRPRPLAPDDDPDFLRQLKRDNDTQQRRPDGPPAPGTPGEPQPEGDDGPADEPRR